MNRKRMDGWVSFAEKERIQTETETHLTEQEVKKEINELETAIENAFNILSDFLNQHLKHDERGASLGRNLGILEDDIENTKNKCLEFIRLIPHKKIISILKSNKTFINKIKILLNKTIDRNEAIELAGELTKIIIICSAFSTVSVALETIVLICDIIKSIIKTNLNKSK